MTKISTITQSLQSALTVVAAPLLFSWYAMAALYQTNQGELTPQEVWLPLTVVTGVIIILAGLLWKVLGDRLKASITLSLLVVTFFSYGHLVTLLGKLIGDDWSSKVVAGLLLVLYAAMLYWLVKSRRQAWPAWTLKVNQLLVVVAGVATLVSLASAIPQQFNRDQHIAAAKESIATLPAKPDSDPTQALGYLPDVYYIVPDRYASSKTLSQILDFDNSQFDQYLTDKGFYLAKDSRANYPKTLFSLPSSLNLDYLQNLIDFSQKDLTEIDTVRPLLSNHTVGRLFQRMGYTYYHINNWYDLAQKPEIADHNLMLSQPKETLLNGFSKQLIDTTYYPQIAKLFNPTASTVSDSGHRAWAEYGFQQLTQSANWPGPKFVMAHILMPHDPYVYQADCQPLPQVIQRWNAEISTYTDQLACSNKLLSQAIDSILANSKQPPIIILQSDEGPEAMVDPTGHHWRFAKASQKAIDQRTQIINAYYFPDSDYSQLYQDITPVNSFRTVFRQYFNYDLPNLPDKTYLFPDEHSIFQPYQMTTDTQP